MMLRNSKSTAFRYDQLFIYFTPCLSHSLHLLFCKAREFGFDGKTLIHPKTVSVANDVFGVSEEEAKKVRYDKYRSVAKQSLYVTVERKSGVDGMNVDQARRIIQAWEQEGHQKGLVVLDGQLVEELHVQEARKIVAISEAQRR